MDIHPEFLDSLKLSNRERFTLIPIIGLTQTIPPHPRNHDQVIGMFYCDTVNYGRRRSPFFKQDFIVNLNSQGVEFVSYSAHRDNGLYVRPLREFFIQYGNNGEFYHRGGMRPWEHHYNDVANLPDYPGLRETAGNLLATL